MKKNIFCPECQHAIPVWDSPSPTVDVVVHHPHKGIVLIGRKNIPHGFALPGGFIDAGECAEAAALRELREETNLTVQLVGLLGVYSDPLRDPRQHTLGLVYVGTTDTPENLQAGDDAASAAFYALDALPTPMAFDHLSIIQHFTEYLAGTRLIAPVQYGY